MLKIKDNVDLKELEKFKFQEGEYVLNPYEKLWFKVKNRLFYNIEIVVWCGSTEKSLLNIPKNKIEIIKHSKRMNWKTLYLVNKNTTPKNQEKYIKDLIQAGLVEMVD